MSHRKAYGPHGTRTPERKAQDIAFSMLSHQAAGVPKTFSDYGITDPQMIVLIQQAYQKLTTMLFD